MEYLRLSRAHIAAATCLAASLLFVLFPGIDVAISKLFFEGGFFVSKHWWPSALQAALPYLLVLSMTCVVGVYLYNRRSRRRLGGIDGRKVLYLFAVLLLGAGLIVNWTFKDHFGRARPRDVAEFGGPRQFTPAFYMSSECDRNCSFPSGDAAAAFFALALARAAGRRRALVAAGIVFGTAVSLSRVAVGAHFFSDVVTSFFVMWILSEVLYHYVVLNRTERKAGLRTLERPVAGMGSSAEFP